MNREQLVRMARHNMARVKSDTTDQTAEILKMPAADYTDPARWQLERERIFLRLPQALMLSCEIREPGQYRSLEVMERPVLVVRQDDGRAQAFLNICTHRGAQLVAVGTGRASRFTCSFHGWSFSAKGKLIGVASAAEFGELDKEANGLKPLPTFERAGVIWAVLTPGSTVDFESFLSGYDQHLAAFNLDKFHVLGHKRLESVNWKLTYDGYVDFYHLPALHKPTFGAKFPNRALNYRWGPHQRVVTPDPSLLKLESRPEQEWPTATLMKGVWPLFPNAAFISIDGQGTRFMFSRILPGRSVGESYSVHTFVTANELITEEEREAAETQFSFLVQVLREEDYTAAAGVQKNLMSGALDHVYFGRNEPGSQNFHKWVDRCAQAATDAQRNALFAERRQTASSDEELMALRP
ncbi:MAG: aromatic ring-hydroxylating dioxygenase subunit alpha [Burkholderiales bacterium]